MININKIALVLLISLSVTTLSVYAVQTVSDRVEITSTSIGGGAILPNDLFGYQIENIGNLDGLGADDLAVIKFGNDTSVRPGSVLIMFMNTDGTVASTNEITMEANLTTGIGNVCFDNVNVNRDTGTLESMAFVGDLDGDGEPTLALGAPSNNHNGTTNSGAVYMLELNSNGTVDNCFPLVPTNNTRTTGFDPDPAVYLDGASFGWPVIATDLNGDGQNELVVGANSVDDDFTNLWPLFLNSSGGVTSHPAVPIFGDSRDIGTDSGDYIDDGKTISGKKIVIGSQNGGDGGGSVFIVNLSTAGAFVSSTKIAGSTIGAIPNDQWFGSGVAPLGDMDGDGINDILVGNAAGDDTNSLSGEAYLLYLNADDTLKESQKISNESEFTRDGSTPFAASDLFGHGMALWQDSGNTAVIAISAHQDDTGGGAGNQGAVYLFSITRASVASIITTGGGGSTDEAKTRPTFGLDHHTFVQRVEGGLVINNVTFDVTDNYFTHIPLQNLTVGEVQNFTAKSFSPKQLRVMEFLFGVPEVGKWFDAAASIALMLDYNSEIVDVKTNNARDAVVDFSVMNYSSSKAYCTSTDNTPLCDRISVELIFNEAPVHQVLALQAIDWKGRNTILYFNDGLNIDGESLNPPKQMQIISEIKYKGLQTIERIDKTNDIWVSTDINEPIALYQQTSLGSFVPYQWREYEKLMDNDGSIMYRDHSYFQMLVELEQERAQLTYDKIMNHVQ